jgi:hypothetical protein
MQVVESCADRYFTEVTKNTPLRDRKLWRDLVAINRKNYAIAPHTDA